MSVQDLELALRAVAGEVRPDEVDAFRRRLVATASSPPRRVTRRRIAVLGGLSALLLGGGVVAVGADGPFDGPARQAFSKVGGGDQAGQVVARATSPDGYHVELRVSEIGDRECVLFESDAPLPRREKYPGPHRATCWTRRAPEDLRPRNGGEQAPYLALRYRLGEIFEPEHRAAPQGDTDPAYGRVRPGSRAVIWRDLYGDVRRCPVQTDGWFFCYVPAITGATTRRFHSGFLFTLLDGVEVERADGHVDVLRRPSVRDPLDG